MFDIERWQEIFETLSKNKLQTFLTMVSVFIGVMTLMILIGFSNGVQNGVRSEFEEDATNRINIFTRFTSKSYKGLNPGRRIQLRNTDFEETNALYTDELEYKTGIFSRWGTQIVYNKQSSNYRLEGAHPDQQFIENQSMLKGRFLNQNDQNNYEKVAVIGAQVQKDLFKTKNPIGEYVKVLDINFKVVGVYSDPGGRREESRVFVPLSTAQRVFNEGDKIRSMVYTVNMSENYDEAVLASEVLAEKIENDIKTKYSIAPDDRAAVRINNTLKSTQKIYSLIDMVKLIFWIVGIGTIIAGVVGVGNIMLVVVKERTKEIGVRKALGASPGIIIGMILQEAIFVTALAGFIGLFTGYAILFFVGPNIDHEMIESPSVDFWTSITIVCIIIFAGVLAGFVPAYRAANIKPIEALRDE